MSEVHFKEIWSISEQRILRFFEHHYFVNFHELQGLKGYIGTTGNTTVQIEILPPNMIMKFPIPRCSVSITGPDTEAEEVHKKFVMNFLSAGG